MCLLSYISTGCAIISKQNRYYYRKKAKDICLQLNEFVPVDQELSESEKTVRKLNCETGHCNNKQISESDVEVNADIATDDNLVKFVKTGKKMVQEFPKVSLSESGKRTIFFFFSMLYFCGNLVY